MKKIVKRYPFLFMLIALVSCTKVISVNLNDAGPQIVIEGVVGNYVGPFQVIITQTVNFSQPNEFPPIRGAIVKITDSTAGINDSLVEGVPGIYNTVKIHVGIPGHVYLLNVVANGQTYTSRSEMPQPVPFDSVTFYTTNIFGTTRISAVANFQDPAGIANYYTFNEYVNGLPIDQTFNFDDRLSDGKYIRRQLFNDSTLKGGDVVRVEMNCVDNAVWQYFNTLGQARDNNSQSVTPANPISNISNNALGYFSAQTTEVRQAFLEH